MTEANLFLGTMYIDYLIPGAQEGCIRFIWIICFMDLCPVSILEASFEEIKVSVVQRAYDQLSCSFDSLGKVVWAMMRL